MSEILYTEEESGLWKLAKFIDFIESMKVLKYKPGDIIVLRVPRYMEREYIDIIKREIAHLVGNDIVKVLTMDDDMDIGVLRKDKG